jgi:hypothetical protein
MNTLFTFLHSYIQTLSWNNYIFLIIIFFFLIVLRQWGIIILFSLTCLLALFAKDLIIMNLQTAKAVVSLPIIIFCLSGIIIAVIALNRLRK